MREVRRRGAGYVRVAQVSISGLPAIPPITVHLLSLKTCWNCGASATVSIRPLTLRFHRFYCHACAKVTR